MTDHIDEECVEGDPEWCEMHQQDGLLCERFDNEGQSGYEECRRWRYDMYIRGDLPPTIVTAAKQHFTAPLN